SGARCEIVPVPIVELPILEIPGRDAIPKSRAASEHKVGIGRSIPRCGYAKELIAQPQVQTHSAGELEIVLNKRGYFVLSVVSPRITCGQRQTCKRIHRQEQLLWLEIK